MLVYTLFTCLFTMVVQKRVIVYMLFEPVIAYLILVNNACNLLILLINIVYMPVKQSMNNYHEVNKVNIGLFKYCLQVNKLNKYYSAPAVIIKGLI